MEHWYEYVRAAYDLILESEGQTAVYLNADVEQYVVHVFAKNFTRIDIGNEPIAIKMMSSTNYQHIGDECLLINSMGARRRRWPSETYYIEMGQTAYGLANIEIMEQHFEDASRVLHTIFKKIG